MKSKQSKNNDRTPQTHVFHFNIIYWICRITLENVDETFTISHGRSELTHSTHRSNIFAREVLFPFHIEFVFSSILTNWWYGTSGPEISLNQIFGKTKRLVFFPTKSEFFKWIFGLSNASHVERCAELIFLADDFNDKSFSRHQTLSLPVQSLVYLASESGVRHNVAARVKCECQTPSSLNAFSRCSMESIQDSVDKIQVFFILSNSLPVQFVWISHHEHWTAHRLSELTRLALDTLIPFEYQFYPVVSIKWICENVHKIR